MLGDALREGGGSAEESAQAYRKATELLPDHPAAFNALATLDLKKGQPAQALPQAQAAVRMAPWDAVMLDTLALALAGVGRCGEAAATEARRQARRVRGAPRGDSKGVHRSACDAHRARASRAVHPEALSPRAGLSAPQVVLSQELTGDFG